ncbi:hypothetical protein ICW40_09345 [Actinotalea ferrariae]|uniref:hypothetical protein n=1 Tax=Actinotalea ferrariae TaxID=1386098 RepID=UPI001C8C198A|nr:hypothetical protein [Actinotalea ferrariae]MBX9245014.1 hypothetical protein [Actinotalea ferrariae]
MTAVTDHALVLDHVAAYATAVRGQLDDLGPEQVDDLTDGLEADLAEALEDPAAAPAGDHLLDLARRFGPAEVYAAELRAAAGLAPRAGRAPAGRGTGVVHGVLDAGRRTAAAARDAAAPLLARPPVRWVVTQARALAPLWWVVRAWCVYVIVTGIASIWYHAPGAERYVPRSVGGVLLLVGLVVLSVRIGQAGRPRDVLATPALAVLNLLALVALPTFVGDAHAELAGRAGASPSTVYVETPVYVTTPPEDGVRVDGMLVSNLFVYDAEGNPLSDVQIFDDRGRQVRTTYDDGMQDWALPGVDELWAFGARTDADGRARWNVYPLRGAPADAWTLDQETGERTADGELRTPPAPFAKAPALVAPDPTSDQAATATP